MKTEMGGSDASGKVSRKHPTCSRCRNHGVQNVRILQHKCPYKECPCEPCLQVKKRSQMYRTSKTSASRSDGSPPLSASSPGSATGPGSGGPGSHSKMMSSSPSATGTPELLSPGSAATSASSTSSSVENAVPLPGMGGPGGMHGGGGPMGMGGPMGAMMGMGPGGMHGGGMQDGWKAGPPGALQMRSNNIMGNSSAAGMGGPGRDAKRFAPGPNPLARLCEAFPDVNPSEISDILDQYRGDADGAASMLTQRHRMLGQYGSANGGHDGPHHPGGGAFLHGPHGPHGGPNGRLPSMGSLNGGNGKLPPPSQRLTGNANIGMKPDAHHPSHHPGLNGFGSPPPGHSIKMDMQSSPYGHPHPHGPPPPPHSYYSAPPPPPPHSATYGNQHSGAGGYHAGPHAAHDMSGAPYSNNYLPPTGPNSAAAAASGNAPHGYGNPYGDSGPAGGWGGPSDPSSAYLNEANSLNSYANSSSASSSAYQDPLFSSQDFTYSAPEGGWFGGLDPMSSWSGYAGPNGASAGSSGVAGGAGGQQTAAPNGSH